MNLSKFQENSLLLSILPPLSFKTILKMEEIVFAGLFLHLPDPSFCSQHETPVCPQQHFSTLTIETAGK